MKNIKVPFTEEDIPQIDLEELENAANQIDEDLPQELSILPVRNTVLFPGIIMPITVGREKSLRLIKKAYKDESYIGVVSQKNLREDEPQKSDLHSVGTIAKIVKKITMPDGNTTIVVQGKQRFELNELTQNEPFLVGKVNYLTDISLDNPKGNKKNEERKKEALIESIKEAAFKILHLSTDIPPEAQIALENIESPNFLINFLSANTNVEVKAKQRLLELSKVIDRAVQLLKIMHKEIQLLELKSDIKEKTNSDLDQQQKEYFLRQQIKTLQDEIGDDNDKDINKLHLKAEKKQWSEETKEFFLKEVNRFSRMNPASPDYSITLSYLEFILDLPWQFTTKDHLDLHNAKKVLDKEHYGLEKIKQRILEYLAVLKLKNTLDSPILCLYGPPGVGKTSLGKSIAKALGRKYMRISLGGMHDESEIRGHRRTYIGAMAGKIMQNVKKAGSSNPVFVLDEIDKVSSDFRGDPSSALLEVLDPEQNDTFVDNYLETEYDLSKVLFIATANSLNTIQPALRDRMEIIEVSGYTIEEKIEIAKRHLVAKQRKNHGLLAKHISFSAETLRFVVEGYTRESGVRSLERQIASLCRSVAKSVAMEENYQKKITPKEVERILGKPSFDKDLFEENETVGVATGLAWTQFGGEILSIEASLSKGKGRITLSGRLGDVMKESVGAALSYLKANAEEWNINHKLFDQYDLHVHVPAGAVPKDGPSAGITMLTAMVSAYSRRRVKNQLAMTGEITLHGKVLPVGGIKEKILAAKRAGINEIVMSKRNQKDIEEIEEHYIKGLTFHFVDRAGEVLKLALLKQQDKTARPLEIQDTNQTKKTDKENKKIRVIPTTPSKGKSGSVGV